jgi:hypothetical protein
VRRAECGHEKLAAFSCKRRGICPSCGGCRSREKRQTARFSQKSFLSRSMRDWKSLSLTR